jgi:hypothetical protein
MAETSRDTRRSRGWTTTIVSWSIGPCFLLLAGWLHWVAPDSRPHIPRTPPIDTAVLAPIPRLPVLNDPASAWIGGFEQRCNDCHRLFESPVDRVGPLYQHTHIVFAHGINDRCFNCHDQEDRQVLVLRDGRKLPFSRTAELCAQCHGTTYRDWERGMHGKTLGAWRPGAPAMRRLVCVECHDPHAPAYDPVEPLPAPHTLRAEHAGAGAGDHGPPASPLMAPAMQEFLRSHEPAAEEGHEAEEGHAP